MTHFKSLFVISLPRSLSSLVYQVVRQHLALAEPEWTSDGELLNNDRYVQYGGPTHDAGVKFTTKDETDRFRRLLAFLDQATVSEGYAYKDVVQPFVVSAWLTAQTGATRQMDSPASDQQPPATFAVLKVIPDIVHVAYSMLFNLDWTYPRQAALGELDRETAVLLGLVRAAQALAAVPGESVTYGQLTSTTGELALTAAVRRLYPDLEIAPLLYQSEVFRRNARRIGGRVTDPRYRRLQERLRSLDERSPFARMTRRSTTPTGKHAQRVPILVVGDCVAATGFARVLESILSRLPARYMIHHLATNYYGDPHRLSWRLYPASLGGDVFGVHRLKAMVDQVRPRLIFLLNDLWVLAQYMPRLRSAASGAAIVMYAPVDGGPVSEEAILALEGADEFVVYTEFARREISAAVDSIRARNPRFRFPAIKVIPHGVDTSVFYPYGIQRGLVSPLARRRAARRRLFRGDPAYGDAFIVLNANRNQPRKRIDTTVEGFAQFAHDKPDHVKLYLHMGLQDTGWNIAQLARRHGVYDRLIVTSDSLTIPSASTSQLNLIYNSCDVGVNTATGEGWGLVSFEHAATGAAQIVPNHSACKELWSGSACLLEPVLSYTNEGTLTVAHFVDPRAVADALGALYEDPDQLRRMSLAAYETATRSDYSWNTIAAQWDAVFEEALDRDPDVRTRR